MALQKGFLKPVFSLSQIPLKRRWLGIISGLGITLTFYAFLQGIQHGIRLFLMTKDRPFGVEYWVLTPESQYGHNIIWAFIAILLGQAVVIQYWFWKPRHSFKKIKFRNYTIVNDSRNYFWVFLSYASRMGFIAFATQSIVYYVDLFELAFGYWGFFLLLFFTLYGHLWLTVLRTYSKVLPLMLKGLLAIILLTGLLAFYNPYDINTVEESQLKTSNTHILNLELPQSHYYERAIPRSLLVRLILAHPKEKYKTIHSILPNLLQKDSTFIVRYLEKDRNDIPQEQQPFRVAHLFIDKNMEMQHVYELEELLVKNELTKINYAVIPHNTKNPHGWMLEMYGVPRRLSYIYCPQLKLKVDSIQKGLSITPYFNDNASSDCIFYGADYFTSLSKVKKAIIELKDDGSILLNQKDITLSQLKSEIKSFILNSKPKNIIFLDSDLNTPFESFLETYVSIRLVYEEIWNEEGLKKHGRSYSALDYRDRREIRRQIPYIFHPRSNNEKIYVEHIENLLKAKQN